MVGPNRYPNLATRNIKLNTNVTIIEIPTEANIPYAPNAIRKNGVSDDVLVSYMCHNLKISKAHANEILDCWDNFYQGIVNKMIFGGLSKEGEE